MFMLTIQSVIVIKINKSKSPTPGKSTRIPQYLLFFFHHVWITPLRSWDAWFATLSLLSSAALSLIAPDSARCPPRLSVSLLSRSTLSRSRYPPASQPLKFHFFSTHLHLRFTTFTCILVSSSEAISLTFSIRLFHTYFIDEFHF